MHDAISAAAEGVAVPGKDCDAAVERAPENADAAEFGLLEFGGEIFVKYESGHIHYQDESKRDFICDRKG